MAEQLNLLSEGNIIPTALHTEMQQSYLEYAMSVIIGRALPDVRDGLKPVHRRILYAMYELGLTPDRPYRKCARVVGDVLGKYHPHGDQSVYDALVRLVQTFSSRYPLLDGHGNFGSVDDDPPAAMRYTETRLAPISNTAMLTEVGLATVDFAPNFDNSQQEPLVLPAQLPILLLNGSSGIAVGMATNIPPHNLNEVVDALIALIDRPEISLPELMQHLPGPDFPTGGQIIDTQGIIQAYETGRGLVTLRGVAQIEEIQPGRGRHRRSAIIVTELPFQVNKAAWIEKIADLSNQGRLEGIADLRDESDRDGMRVVIELKREGNPQKVLEQLYRQTVLQTNFGVILLAIVNGQPRQLSLIQLLQEFLNFREETLIRRYQHELDQAQTRSHIVEGLLAGLNDLDRLIDLLRQAPDGPTAKINLQTEFDLSDRQADALLAMPLRRLTGLERENLEREFQELSQRIQDLQTLLGSRHELLKALKKELRQLKRQFGDPRRTQILTDVPDLPVISTAEVDTPPDLPVMVEVSQKGYGRCLTSLARNSFVIPPQAKQQWQDAKKDYPIFQAPGQRQHTLYLVGSNGKAYSVPVAKIPLTERNQKGQPLQTLLPDSAQGEQLIQFWLEPATDAADSYPDFVLLTHQARIKRIPATELTGMNQRALQLIKLKDDDALDWVIPILPAQTLIVATSTSRILRFQGETIPIMSRTSAGVAAFKLGTQERIIGAIATSETTNLLLVTAQGYAKQISVNEVRPIHLGQLGTMTFKFTQPHDYVAGLVAVSPPFGAEVPEVGLVTNRERWQRITVDQIPCGHHASSIQIVSMEPEELVTQILPSS
ncbi:DNA topoisomerase (ATP-hydrolyzing) subunit A [Synechococcus sp. PCC 6312]|uniref:DNA gyrase/topoisomerase IV subunit A n=1 Tax=Synechococcus sp. (strain ATCC 27167 / PCC 6312) TaxID=195253 RepID=UPI00029F16C7|nr:DNA topoisomerase (ATP-hydrolyzing) [Synechococcus sp. PCC 6312]AFY59445.1 type IIA topoisomerase (DNA gyrase/topo II, topoisomerase IV), A subunit [Synechococcus sp. PCC 6312]